MTAAAEPWLDATKLLRELAILHPEEIDVEAIAEHVGATVVYEELRGCGGCLMARGDRAIITADRSAPRPEQRMAVAHELAHWLLDRGESGIVPSDPWGVVVSWFDEDGYDEDVTPEHRADEWAVELLLPVTMLGGDELPVGGPVTFAEVRELCRRFETPLLPTARQMIRLSSENTALVRSRRSGDMEIVRRSFSGMESWLRPPGPSTVAHQLLHGQLGEEPGATRVGSEGWVDMEQAWWCRVSEDSLRVADGEVLSLLWWPGDAMGELTADPSALPREPGEESVLRLAKTMGESYGYYPVGWSEDELVMETREPSVQRMALPRTDLDAERIRGLVAEVAGQKGVRVDEVLAMMMD